MGVGGSRGHRGRIDANNYSGRMEGVYITRNTIPYGKETIARNGKLFGILLHSVRSWNFGHLEVAGPKWKLSDTMKHEMKQPI